MKKVILLIVCVVTLCSFSTSVAQEKIAIIESPDKAVKVTFKLTKGMPTYQISYLGKEVLAQSKMGLVLSGSDFSKDLSFSTIGKVQKVAQKYSLFYAKQRLNAVNANRVTISLTNTAKQPLQIVFQVANDGIGFQYLLPKIEGTKNVNEEVTSFQFPAGTKAWLQQMQVSKTGWESSNPAYEENYEQDIPVGTPSPTAAGWVYPALFKTNNTWLLLTEADLDGTYCATRLKSESPNGEYQIGFPSSKEIFTEGAYLPIFDGSGRSPWRIIVIGSLKMIMESSLGTDFAAPQIKGDFSFVQPGKASWSWINSKDNFIIYEEQVKYIDYAADMHWEYCLIDADWDRKIGYDKVKELSAYAKTKNVKLLLWYNSAGNWNTVKYTPKNLLITHEGRMKEFSRLNDMGIAGVKIDFFGGDGQSVIQYYIDILKDAAEKKLMVNFHGATLPRGWSRTYPNLMTAEAVKGFEMITFNQSDADKEANHATMLPFARNVFDPMDFTPMNLYKIPTKVIRKTSSTFELALSLVFTSGIQHFAESPQGMKHVTPFVKVFLQQLPSSWDEVRYLDGEPGKFIAIARRSGDKWYIAGINGQTLPKLFSLNLSLFKRKKGILITDGDGPGQFSQREIDFTSGKDRVKTELEIKPAAGFVIVLQ